MQLENTDHPLVVGGVSRALFEQPPAHPARRAVLRDVRELVRKQALPLASLWVELTFGEEEVDAVRECAGVDVSGGLTGLSAAMHPHPPQIHPQPPLKLPANPLLQGLPRLAQHPMHRRRRHYLPA